MNDLIKLINNTEYSATIENINIYNQNELFLNILKLRRYDLILSNNIKLDFHNNIKKLIDYLLSDDDIIYKLEKIGFKFSNAFKENIKKFVGNNLLTYKDSLNNFMYDFFETQEEIDEWIKDYQNQFIQLFNQNQTYFPYKISDSEEFIKLILREKKTDLIKNIENYSIENLKSLASLIDKGFDLPYYFGNDKFASNLFSKKDSLEINEFFNLLKLLKERVFYVRKTNDEEIDSFTLLVKDNIDYLIEITSKIKMVPKCLVDCEYFKNECIKRNKIDLLVQCTLPNNIISDEELLNKFCKELNITKFDMYSRLKWLYEYYPRNINIFHTFITNMLKNKTYNIDKWHLERLINDINIQMKFTNLTEQELTIINEILNMFDYYKYDITVMIFNLINNINCYKDLINSINIKKLNKKEINLLIQILSDNTNYYNINSLEELKEFLNIKEKRYLDDLKYKDINTCKENLVRYLFNIDLSEAKIINHLYCYDRDKCVLEELSNSELPRNIFNILYIINTIVETNNLNILNNIFNNKQIPYKLGIPLDVYLRSEYAKLYSNKLYKVNSLDENDSKHLKPITKVVNYNKKDIDIIIPRDSFYFLVHCVGTCSNKEDIIDSNYQKDWEERAQMQDHFVACSFINEKKIYSLVSNGIVAYGFSNIEGSALYGMGDCDIDSIGTYARTYNSSKELMNQGNRAHFFVPSLLLNSTQGYNEIVIERRNNTPYKKNIKRYPNYIIMTIDSLENKDNFRLIDDILINELSFLPEMDKFLLKNTNEKKEIQNILSKNLDKIPNSLKLQYTGKKHFINSYTNKILTSKYYEESLKASLEFNVPLIVIDKLYYLKKLLTESNIYDIEMKNNLLDRYINSDESKKKEIFNLISKNTDYESIISKIEPQIKSMSIQI